MKIKSNPKISFIVPCYNVEHYIGECINSILRQTYRNIEIISIDDGSPDKSGEILDELSAKDCRIKVMHKKNAGVSSARNAGIEVATGDYIVFVDGDDYISEDYAEYMLGLISEYNADMALSINCYMSNDEKQVAIEEKHIMTPEDATTLLLGPRVTVGSWNKIYKKSLISDNNLRFSTSQFYGEGLLFITTAAQFANGVVVGNRKVYYYRRNNYSSACTKFNVENFYNGFCSLEIIEKELKIRTFKVLRMLYWHKCQFKMGTVVRIRAANVVETYYEFYQDSLHYVRTNMWKCLLISGISFYKKCLLIGTAISPSIMAKLDIKRRHYIEKHSVN